jgi:hypothetical protein
MAVHVLYEFHDFSDAQKLFFIKIIYQCQTERLCLGLSFHLVMSVFISFRFYLFMIFIVHTA